MCLMFTGNTTRLQRSVEGSPASDTTHVSVTSLIILVSGGMEREKSYIYNQISRHQDCSMCFTLGPLSDLFIICTISRHQDCSMCVTHGPLAHLLIAQYPGPDG